MRFNLNSLMRNVDRGIQFPVKFAPPESLDDKFEVDLIQDSATYKPLIIEQPGWYYLTVGASNGNKGQTSAGIGGRTSDFVYLYKDTKILMWGSSSHLTGYIAPDGVGGNRGNNPGKNGVLGGGGAARFNVDGGAGGGGAGGYGGVNSTDDDWGYGGRGGGGAGIIAGLDTVLNHTENWKHNRFSCKSVIAMVLSGGGGGGPSDHGSNRMGGGGGGAWGNGGDANQGGLTYGGIGPGDNSFGKGGTVTGIYAPGANGAWAIRNYSTNTFKAGTGTMSETIQPATNSVAIYWIINQIREPDIKYDLGLISDKDEKYLDCGLIAESIDNIIDCEYLRFAKSTTI